MNKYDDIIDLIYYGPRNHKRMSMESRASQFSPFAALDGYYDLLRKEDDVSLNKLEMSLDDINLLDRKLQIIKNNINNKFEVTFIYYDNGKYISKTGIVLRIDCDNGKIILFNGEEIIISNVIDIISDDLFNFHI